MINKVRMEDIPEGNRELVEVIGLDAFKKLVKYMGGCILYIPLESSITRVIRNRLIRSAFNGDYKGLAKSFRISESHIRKIINGIDENNNEF